MANSNQIVQENTERDQPVYRDLYITRVKQFIYNITRYNEQLEIKQCQSKSI